MSEPAPPPSNSRASGPNKPPGSGDGPWKLDLMNGTAWFSEWFYRRLQWPVQVSRKRLDDLRPNLQAGAWETLLHGIRAHLERQVPLEARIPVQLPGGQIEWWCMQGSVEHNAFGKPMYLKGSVRVISAEQRPDAADPQP
jgi:hypothetical protein